MWTDQGAHRHMNVEIGGTEVAQFPEKENIKGIFVAVLPRELFILDVSI